jgi:hypothetical protein
MQILDKQNPDGYSIVDDGEGIELQFSGALLRIDADGSWELMIF